MRYTQLRFGHADHPTTPRALPIMGSTRVSLLHPPANCAPSEGEHSGRVRTERRDVVRTRAETNTDPLQFYLPRYRWLQARRTLVLTWMAYGRAENPQTREKSQCRSDHSDQRPWRIMLESIGQEQLPGSATRLTTANFKVHRAVTPSWSVVIAFVLGTCTGALYLDLSLNCSLPESDFC